TALGAQGVALKKDAVTDLADALKDKDVVIRRAAAAALVQAGPAGKDALASFIDALKDTDLEVRRSALDAIGKLGADGKLASPDVGLLIGDPEPQIRKAAGLPLGQIAPDAALPAYASSLASANDGVRLDAAEFLVSLGAKAKPRLADLIASLGDK